MAQSSGSVAPNTDGIQHADGASPLWRHVTTIHQLPGGGGYIWRCCHCNKEYRSSYFRVKAHLCGIPLQGIKVCPGPNKKGLPAEQIAAYIREQEDADAACNRAKGMSHPLAKKGKSRQPPIGTGLSEPAGPHPFMPTPPASSEENILGSRKRGPLEKAFKNEAREIADQSVARCIYANGLPFNLVRSPYWREMVTAISRTSGDYVSPGYEKVRTTLLANEKHSVEQALRVIKDTWPETGVSIVSDGWKDCKNRPLINVIAVSPKGAMFLKAVDCEGQVKDATFIANILIEAIEMVGSENVVQVITDNAKNCRAAGILVEGRYGHIFWTPCTVHSLNLVLQKIGTQIEWVKQIYTEGEEIQMFVTNHHMSQAIFRTFSKLELLKVAETRFASHTIVLRRLVKVRESLSSMVINSLWSVWRQSSSERAQKVKALILDDDWWARVEYVLKFTEPIFKMIRYADTDRPCLGEIYDGMDSMVEQIRTIIQTQENDPTETFFKTVQKIIVDRWNKMTTPLHLLAFALSPKYYSKEILSLPRRVPPYRDAEVAAGYKAAFAKMFADEEIQNIVMNEFADFISSKNQDHIALRDKYKKDAHDWWYLHGQGSIYLQPLAIKILSQVASSSSAERNWSTYSFIHSVKRNRLGAKKAEDLVYVHSNLRLLSHKTPDYNAGVTKYWDLTPECADLDATIAQLAEANIDEAASAQDIASGSGSGPAFECGSNEVNEPNDELVPFEEDEDY